MKMKMKMKMRILALGCRWYDASDSSGGDDLDESTPWIDIAESLEQELASGPLVVVDEFNGRRILS